MGREEGNQIPQGAPLLAQLESLLAPALNVGKVDTGQMLAPLEICRNTAV